MFWSPLVMAMEHFKHQDIIIRIHEKICRYITVIKELNYRIEKYCDILKFRFERRKRSKRGRQANDKWTNFVCVVA